MGIPNCYVNIIVFLYSNQYISVKFNNIFSSKWKILNGVRQGGILSPFLFNIYIDDLIKHVSSSPVGCNLGIFKSNIIGYADDLVVIILSLYALQILLYMCYNQSNKLLLNLNTDKRVCIKLLKGFSQSIIQPDIRLGSSILKFVSIVTYLGYELNFNLCNKEKRKKYVL